MSLVEKQIDEFSKNLAKSVRLNEKTIKRNIQSLSYSMIDASKSMSRLSKVFRKYNNFIKHNNRCRFHSKKKGLVK